MGLETMCAQHLAGVRFSMNKAEGTPRSFTLSEQRAESSGCLF